MTLLNSVASLLLNQKTQNCRKPLHTLYAASSEEFFLGAVAEGCHNGAARADPKRALLAALRAVEDGAVRRLQVWFRECTQRRRKPRAAPKKMVAPRAAPVYVQMSENLKPARGTVPEARVRVISEAAPRPEPAASDISGGFDSRYGRKWNPKNALAQRRAAQAEAARRAPVASTPEVRESPARESPFEEADPVAAGAMAEEAAMETEAAEAQAPMEEESPRAGEPGTH